MTSDHTVNGEAPCDCLGCRIARMVDEGDGDMTNQELLMEMAAVMGRIIAGAPEGTQPRLLAQCFDQIASAAGYDCVHGPLPASLH